MGLRQAVGKIGDGEVENTQAERAVDRKRFAEVAGRSVAIEEVADGGADKIAMPYVLFSQMDRGVVAAHFVHVIDDVIRLEDQLGGKIPERHVEHHGLLLMPRQRRKVRNHGRRRS